MKLLFQLVSWDCSNQRIFVRADLNVPLDNGKIVDDIKLQAVQPTLDYILKQNGTVILATHLGRPKGIDSSLSTERLVPWFKKNKYSIIFAPTLNEAYKLSFNNPKTIILLENLRFFPEEKDQSIDFAKQLAQCADRFVQDAFGALHRNETSITLLPLEFNESHRSVGFLIKKEIEELNTVCKNPKSPFCLILGGKKIKDKIELLKHLLPLVDTILLCPAILFSFMKAMGKSVGKSLVDESVLDQCKEILALADSLKKKIVFPIDFQVATGSIEGKLSYTDHIESDQIGISIGPKTIELFTPIIEQSNTIFFNGAIGFLNRKETLVGMESILNAMAKSKGKTVVAGGDSIAAAHILNIKGIDYYSTGGGATLSYLTGKPLPGLKPFYR